MKKWTFFVLMLFVFGLFCRCSKMKKARSANPSVELYTASNTEGGAEIFFWTFKAHRDGAKPCGERIESIGNKTVGGRLKNKLEQKEALKDGHFLCRFWDDKNQILAEIQVEDPLFATVEYPTDNGKFERADLKKQEAEFFIRVQNDSRFKILTIEKRCGETDKLIRVFSSPIK
jgi:hypothetical protein